MPLFCVTVQPVTALVSIKNVCDVLHLCSTVPNGIIKKQVLHTTLCKEMKGYELILFSDLDF